MISFSAIKKFHALDLEVTDQYLSRTPFHPGYWSRIRIDGAVGEHASLASGILLDVGCGRKQYEKLFTPYVKTYLGIEYSPESGYRGNLADLCGDASMLPIADESVDTILCTEVLEHLPDPESAVREFVRVLRPGGAVITTAPFFFPVHDTYDFFRYSPDGLAAIMKRNMLEIEKVVPLSGTAVTLALLLNLYWCDIGFFWTKWLYPIGVLLRPILWLICFVVNVVGRVFEVLLPSSHMSFNHLTIARKPLHR